MAPLPPDEPRRLEALLSYGLLDTPPEPLFDGIVALAARVCEAPGAALVLVDEHRQWPKARFGTDLQTTPRAQSFCAHALDTPELLLVPDALRDPRFADNPLVLQDGGIRFYAGAPLRTAQGLTLGALCVTDHHPRSLDPLQQDVLRTLAGHVMTELELRRQSLAHARSAAALERKMREQRLEAELLESLARGQPFAEMLTQVALGVESLTPGAMASVLLLDPDGLHLRSGAAPHLPAGLVAAVDGVAIGPAVGSCGTAAWRKELVVVSDIDTDPLWDSYRALAQAQGLRACWSKPVLDAEGRVMATLALYFRHPRQAAPAELALLERMAHVVGIVIEHARKERAMRDSEERFRRTFQDAAIGMAVTDIEGRILQANQAFCTMLGYTEAALQGMPMQALTHPEDLSSLESSLALTRAGKGETHVYEKRYLAREGRIVWSRASICAHRDGAGRTVGMIGIAEDITEQKLAQEALSHSQALLRIATGMSRLGAWAVDLPAMEVHWSNEVLAIYDLPPGGRLSVQEAMQFYAPESRERIQTAFETCLTQGTPFDEELRFTTARGQGIWVRVVGEAVRNAAGAIHRLQGAIQDISQHRAAAEAVRESAERFRLVSRATSDAIWDWDLRTDAVWWSDGFDALVGAAGGRLAPTRAAWTARIHPEDRADALAEVQRALAARQPRWKAQYRFAREDGRYLQVEDRGHVIHDAQGDAVRMVGGITDLTERRALEEQLRQAQRLELVGQLTGGVAHDFNNLLTVIMGNAELMTEQLPPDSRMAALGRLIGEAAQRGASLTQQLLAFARRQTLKPEVVDANELIRSVSAMLRRTLGSHVEVLLRHGQGCHLLADPGQLEAALLNLCINARDAMPSGGRLTIETASVSLEPAYAQQHADVAAGPYILVAVSDTGSGIDPRHLDRVFEPFFTTKEKGRGTGLGLSMVYGFVKQSRGHITIYSELGHGTTIRMYLPCAEEGAVASHAAAGARQAGPLPRGSESILLVEDDPLVRQYAEEQLTALGYQVLAAHDGPSALAALRQHRQVSLLFTDVMMPGGMNGRELGEAARRLRPDLRLLLTSGYTANVLVHEGRMQPGTHLLNKPYHQAELARMVRLALESTP